MAKETKAERLAREQALRQTAWEQSIEKWTERVLDLVYQYSNHPSGRFSVDQVNRSTYCFQTSQNYDSEFSVASTAPTQQDWCAYYELEAAEERLEAYRLEKEEEELRYRFREATRDKARALFTAEELEVLGLK